MSKQIARLLVTQRKRSSKPRSAKLPAAAVPTANPVRMRLRRVEGQVRGIIKMIEQDQTTEAIAQQLSAARHALDRAFFTLLASDLEGAILTATTLPDRKRKLSESIRLLAKYS